MVGNLILLYDGAGNAEYIQWKSRCIKRVVKSTLAAECLALEDEVDYAYYVKCMIMDIFDITLDEIEMNYYIDKSLYEVLHSSTNIKDDERLIQYIFVLKEMMDKQEINSINLVESKRNLADVLTKRGASFQILQEVIHLGSTKCL